MGALLDPLPMDVNKENHIREKNPSPLPMRPTISKRKE